MRSMHIWWLNNVSTSSLLPMMNPCGVCGWHSMYKSVILHLLPSFNHLVKTMCTRARDLLLRVFLFNHIHELFNSYNEHQQEWSPIRNLGSVHLLQQKYAKSVRVSTIGWTMAKLVLKQSIQCSRALIYAFVHIIIWNSLVFYFCMTKASISIEIHTE